jgi:acyl-CoA synthetase (AMP-forming)/AMP-acid ligase II
MPLPPPFPRISDCLNWHAERQPDAEALVIDGRRISYAQLAAQVDEMARALMASGVAKGDRVATLQTPSPEFLIAFIATASIGAIWAGLNPKYRRDELLHPVRDCQPKLLLARREVHGRRYEDEIAAMREAGGIETLVGYEGGDAGLGLLSMPEFLARADTVTQGELAARRAESGGREACLLVYTSGTTGTPKGAVLHQQAIIDFALEQNRIWPVEPNRALNHFPVNHVGCTVDLAIPVLMAGGCTIFLEQFEPGRTLDIMEAERVTFWGSIPAVFSLQLAEQARRPRDLSAVQMIVWEGAAIPQDILDALAQFGVPMATNYGQTESTSAMAAEPPTTAREPLLNSVGHVFPGVELRLLAADGTDVPDGEPGEVCARSAYNFLGYWNRPEATAQAFTADGFLRTGDLAIRRPDGRYRIVGRVREMFKSGGYNVYPREVEMLLETHPAVTQAIVVAVPDPLWQEVGVAFLTVSSETTPDEILAYARERLANYKVPKRLLIEAELPLLPVGKVDRTALRKRAEAEAAA